MSASPVESPVHEGILAETSSTELHDRQKTDEQRKAELRADLERWKEEGRIAEEEAQAAARRRRELDPLERLAKRRGKTTREYAKTIPADTLRRLQYGVLEIVNEDGTITFKDDPLPPAVREQQTASASAARLSAEREQKAQREQWKKTGNGPRTRSSGVPIKTGLHSG